MRHNPANPHWPDRDRFVLSAGHACILQYAALHLSGYDLTLDDLQQFRQWGSRTPGHPECGHTAGVETTTGPLGQGFANGVGMAIAQRFLADRYNRPHHEIVDHRIYAICSDGDLMEGVTSRGRVDRRAPRARRARLRLRRQPHHDRRDDLALVHDRGQGQAVRGLRLARPARRRLRGSRRAARGALAAAEAEDERPSLIVVRSHIGYPAPHAHRHRRRRTARRSARPRCVATKEILGLDPDATFAVPDARARAHARVVAERGAELEAEWDERFAAWAAAFPGLRRGARARPARASPRRLARGPAGVPRRRGAWRRATPAAR